MTIDSNQFSEILARGREQRSVEFKGPGSRKLDKELTLKVVRACLSMANNRYGGKVLIGIGEDRNGTLQPLGLSPEQLATWKYDDLADTLAEYAEPIIGFDAYQVPLDGKVYIVVDVEEFSEIPILCKKDYKGVLRKGACYVRTRRKPETVEIPSQEDMRDLLDLATEKGVRRFVSQAHSAGLVISGAQPPTDEDLFKQQLDDLRGAGNE